MARIVIAGYMLRHPVAGNVLAFFQYAFGLHRLGHEVAYVEESGWPNASYDPVAGTYGEHPAAGLRIVRGLFAACGMPGPVCFVHRESGRIDGAEWPELTRLLG